MDNDEKKWIEDAVQLCVEAERKGMSLLIRSRNDDNNPAFESGDVVVCSSKDKSTIMSLAFALDCDGSEQR